MKNKKDLLQNIKLDKEELKVEADIRNGNYISDPLFHMNRPLIIKAAKKHLKFQQKLVKLVGVLSF